MRIVCIEVPGVGPVLSRGRVADEVVDVEVGLPANKAMSLAVRGVASPPKQNLMFVLGDRGGDDSLVLPERLASAGMRFVLVTDRPEVVSCEVGATLDPGASTNDLLAVLGGLPDAPVFVPLDVPDGDVVVAPTDHPAGDVAVPLVDREVEGLSADGPVGVLPAEDAGGEFVSPSVDMPLPAWAEPAVSEDGGDVSSAVEPEAGLAGGIPDPDSVPEWAVPTPTEVAAAQPQMPAGPVWSEPDEVAVAPAWAHGDGRDVAVPTEPVAEAEVPPWVTPEAGPTAVERPDERVPAWAVNADEPATVDEVLGRAGEGMSADGRELSADGMSEAVPPWAVDHTSPAGAGPDLPAWAEDEAGFGADLDEVPVGERRVPAGGSVWVRDVTEATPGGGRVEDDVVSEVVPEGAPEGAPASPPAWAVPQPAAPAGGGFDGQGLDGVEPVVSVADPVPVDADAGGVADDGGGAPDWVIPSGDAADAGVMWSEPEWAADVPGVPEVAGAASWHAQSAPATPGRPVGHGWAEMPDGGFFAAQHAADEAQHGRLGTRTGSGEVIVFSSFKGGTGKSTQSILAASILADVLKDKRVCLFDANVPQGSVGRLIMDLRSESRSLSNIIDEPFSEDAVRSIVTQIEGTNLSAVFAPLDKRDGYLDVNRVMALSRVLSVLRKDFAYVVVDTPVAEAAGKPLFDRFVIPEADHLVVVNTCNNETVSNNLEWLEILTDPVAARGKNFPEDRIHVLLNRAKTGVGLDPPAIRTLFARWGGLVGEIPESAEIERASNDLRLHLHAGPARDALTAALYTITRQPELNRARSAVSVAADASRGGLIERVRSVFSR